MRNGDSEYRMRVRVLIAVASILAFGGIASAAEEQPGRLKVGVVQMGIDASVGDNCNRIVSRIAEAASLGVRVAVFPEGVLRGRGSQDLPAIERSIDSISQAAKTWSIYVVLGGVAYSDALRKEVNWARAIGPDGRQLFHCMKLYDDHQAAMPGVFSIDGIPCSIVICADRWLRGVTELPIQRGAQISFELSSNFACEWVAPFEWYWYVPRALRNNVFVIFANTANKASGNSDASGTGEVFHGHSAVIAPDGRFLASSRTDAESILVAELELSEATRAEALARSSHSVFRRFWETGASLSRGTKIKSQPAAPLRSADASVTLAAAQIAGGLSDIERMIRVARERHADLVAFQSRLLTVEMLEPVQRAARENRIIVVAGLRLSSGETNHNTAVVIGADGRLMTRYHQLSASIPFKPGTDPASMWFWVKGIPAIVTLERDALWTEIAELAAVAGAQIHVHLDSDAALDPEEGVRRLQVAANMASFNTFTVSVNSAGSTIWDDLHGADESRAVVLGLPRPATGPVEVFSPFSANLVARAGAGPELLVATRRVPALNPHHPRRTSNLNPQMDAWYTTGAKIIHPQ